MVTIISAAQWDIVCAIEEFWHTNRFFPSTAAIAETTGLSQDFVNENLFADEVRKRIDSRGISYDATPPVVSGELSKNNSRLSDKQLAAAMTVLNIADNRGLKTKLDALGIPLTTYNGWMKSKVFMDFMNTQMETMFGSAMPLAHKALIDKVIAGDLKAIKLFYEMTGRWNGQQSSEVQNVKIIVLRVIEILQKYVQDPVVLRAIAEEMKMVVNLDGGSANGYDATPRAQLASGS